MFHQRTTNAKHWSSAFKMLSVDYSLHCIPLHFPQKPYALVSGITKESLQSSDGVIQ